MLLARVIPDLFPPVKVSTVKLFLKLLAASGSCLNGLIGTFLKVGVRIRGQSEGIDAAAERGAGRERANKCIFDPACVSAERADSTSLSNNLLELETDDKVKVRADIRRSINKEQSMSVWKRSDRVSMSRCPEPQLSDKNEQFHTNQWI